MEDSFVEVEGSLMEIEGFLGLFGQDRGFF